MSKDIGKKTDNLLGKTFGQLSVIEYAGKNKYRLSIWKCECSCENRNQIYVTVNHLNSGKRTHCGCIPNPYGTTHGKTKTVEYKSWVSMRERCINPKSSNYHNYGGRGITVCERWLDKEKGFENFLEDIGERPNNGKKYSLDRVDVNGNYCPENCKWSDSKEQSINRRDTVYLTYNGQTLPLLIWSNITGISESCLRSRKKQGYSDEITLTKPVRKRIKNNE